MTNVSEFDYDLPKQLIAQTPAVPRESARLLVLRRKNGSIHHAHISDLPEYFSSGDVIVLNNTKVFHARLHGDINGKTVELFLIRPREDRTWLALGKPGKKITAGAVIRIAGDFSGTVTDKFPDGTFSVDLKLPPDLVIDKANTYGEVPVPPYIRSVPKDADYQTVYAKYNGSVAAPTAGFHLTKNILKTLKEKGVQVLEITLHVGIGTFMPMKSDTVENHRMHSEWVEVQPDVSRYILQAKKDGRRIIAIGTTTVRTLEGTKAKPCTGDVDIFITPGYKFQIVDSMLTNFHLPKSTLIVLVSAFAGKENIFRAYTEAIHKKYRFYSFGDAMLIL